MSTLDEEQIEALYAEASFGAEIADLSRGDAGHVIMALAAVDHLLEVLLMAHLPRLSEEYAKLLFSDRGPLESLLAKAKLAIAVGLIDTETYQDFKGAQKVRNAFAHPRGFLHFNSPEVDAAFKGIKHWPTSANLRALFDERLECAASKLKTKFDALINEHASKGE